MDRKRLLRSPLAWLAVVVIAFVLYSLFSDDTRGYAAKDTSVALSQLESGNVTNALIDDKEQRLRLTLKNGVDGESKIYAQYPAGASDAIFAAVQKAAPTGGFNTKVTSDNSIFSILIYLLPIGLILFFLFWMMNNSQGGGNKVMGFGKSKAKLLNKDMPSTKFTDVAGADEAVEELYEIKDFLQNPARYQALGAKIPKGVLLYGPPGTGKTLLARAVAGEAGVPFYTISGSDFVEMFVGVGASRVRDLFEQAKANSPAIIFVDEIDAVGRHRGAGMGGGHDEREQTLNQLLVEMDGFEAKGGIILIAATNRPDILDPALLRPGRFDRQIPVTAPDLRGRQAVLAVHAKGKPFADDVDFVALSKRTVGMSGADLANVINEAALLTARFNGNVITNAALEESVDRVTSGPARKGKVISEKERKITAYHEGGHTLAAWAMEDLEPVYKVTIMPRGRTGGHALVVPEDDKGLLTRSEMIARLVMAMGGRAAEELVFAEPTTGASSDIAMATKTARAMVTEYGMSAKLGAVKYGTGDDEPFLGRTYGSTPSYSHETAGEIDDEVRALIEAAHTEAWAVLNENRDILDKLAMELLEKETLDRKDLTRIFVDVVKRPKITSFDEFGARIPSTLPPIKTPGELAIERGEEWPRKPAAPAYASAGQQGYLLPPGQPSGVMSGAAPSGPVGFPSGGSPYGQADVNRYGYTPAPPPGAPGYQGPQPATNGGAPHNGYHGSSSGDSARPMPSNQGGYQPAGQLPANWTGGVLSGPLGPLPGRNPDAPAFAEGPTGYEAGVHPQGQHGYPHMGPAAPETGGWTRPDLTKPESAATAPQSSDPTDPWAPPKENDK
ncbi:ATP-dependent zinc metalloprotease FtsH [Nakamurella antarctica]|uniref:ATP-dependent zinc metalloprotease FtsH n=1 Tax=Nakamurella antarctica TaxID=1902245 RepID=A0A3G8ZP62_9ACTN|nr:ATP-dependent zinc metalloprotease FtsH [Nakamurella antarctica]AZI58918.1 ATP-dependent zinc metalloprotease FtsH [Nakamurella antarctica]